MSQAVPWGVYIGDIRVKGRGTGAKLLKMDRRRLYLLLDWWRQVKISTGCIDDDALLLDRTMNGPFRQVRPARSQQIVVTIDI